ncbi:MAG TPA: acyl-CoA dehydrogenase family protein [Devosiaceae bacterium]|nr:acyl-CoA dehydrogenase family protein [Devosiaceae bacterium]
MTQIDLGWGAGPSARYDELAAPFRPIFARIREKAVERELTRTLPREEIGWLKEAGFLALRVPSELGGKGATLPEYFALLIELGEADPNVVNALRSHGGFLEDLLVCGNAAWREKWLERSLAGKMIGSGFSEVGDNKVGVFSTRLERDGDHWRLNGKKFYTTGALFADFINLGATDENGEGVGAVVPTSAEGVEILDDWDGFGQALSASGTAIFTDVRVESDLVNPPGGRCKYVGGFFQLVHIATLAGVGRAAANDVARLVVERTRVYGHGNASRVSQDPQILQVVGKVRGAAYAAGATALKAAEALQRAYEAHFAGDTEAEDRAAVLADIEVNQSVTPVTNLILDASTVLFDALGASAARKGLGLDRHWRNARTIASHNPRIYRDRIIGDFAVNGARPPARAGVGQAVAEPAKD